MSDKEIRQRIDEAIAKLSPEHRTAIVMREIDGLEYTEIAEQMGCSLGTVMSPPVFTPARNSKSLLKDVYENHFEEQFTAWVDGKLTGAELAEFEKQLEAHPEAVAEKEDALKLGQLLRAHPTAPSLTNPDFFNHQLMQRIAAETPRAAASREEAGHFSGRLPRLAWAGAFCLGVALALFETMIPGGAKHIDKSNYFAQVVENWPANPNVSASTIYSPDDNMTVGIGVDHLQPGRQYDRGVA
ncbi:MAG: sigma factor-like helix-turn-helix DNA-binding protein [Chthoniobacter sp.]